jgi:hypothetical protein
MSPIITKEYKQLVTVFCQAEGIVYYDVQLDMVERICNHIEKTWQVQPQLSFYDAFEKAKQAIPSSHFQKKSRWDEYHTLPPKEEKTFFKYLLINLAFIFTIVIMLDAYFPASQSSIFTVKLTIHSLMVTVLPLLIFYIWHIKKKATHQMSFLSYNTTIISLLVLCLKSFLILFFDNNLLQIPLLPFSMEQHHYLHLASSLLLDITLLHIAYFQFFKPYYKAKRKYPEVFV